MTTHNPSPFAPAQLHVDPASAQHQIIALSKMYTDPITACVREYVANARDTHVDAGTPNATIDIHCPTQAEPWFSITDSGMGMSEEHARRYAVGYGDSPKRKKANSLDPAPGQAGSFGYGFKVGLAVGNQIDFTTVHNGKLTTGALFYNDNRTGVDTFVSTAVDTDQPNGTTVTVTIDSYLKKATNPAYNYARDYRIQHDWLTKIIRATDHLPTHTIRISNIGDLEPDDVFYASHRFDNLTAEGYVIPLVDRNPKSVFTATDEVTFISIHNIPIPSSVILDGVKYPFDPRTVIDNIPPSVAVVITTTTEHVSIPNNRDNLVFDDATKEHLTSLIMKGIAAVKQPTLDYVRSKTPLQHAIDYQVEDQTHLLYASLAELVKRKETQHSDAINEELDGINWYDWTYRTNTITDTFTVFHTQRSRHSDNYTNKCESFTLHNGHTQGQGQLVGIIHENVISAYDSKKEPTNAPAIIHVATPSDDMTITPHMKGKINKWRKNENNPVVIISSVVENAILTTDDYDMIYETFDDFYNEVKEATKVTAPKTNPNTHRKKITYTDKRGQKVTKKVTIDTSTAAYTESYRVKFDYRKGYLDQSLIDTVQKHIDGDGFTTVLAADVVANLITTLRDDAADEGTPPQYAPAGWAEDNNTANKPIHNSVAVIRLPNNNVFMSDIMAAAPTAALVIAVIDNKAKTNALSRRVGINIIEHDDLAEAQSTKDYYRNNGNYLVIKGIRQKRIAYIDQLIRPVLTEEAIATAKNPEPARHIMKVLDDAMTAIREGHTQRRFISLGRSELTVPIRIDYPEEDDQALRALEMVCTNMSHEPFNIRSVANNLAVILGIDISHVDDLTW